MRFFLALGMAGGLLAHSAQAQQPVLQGAPAIAVPMPAQPGLPATGPELPIEVGQSYSVAPRTGPPFVGKLVGTTAQTLTFEIKNQGAVTVNRADVSGLVVQAPQQVQQTRRPYDYVGNGTHMYLFPTARNLRRGEAELQFTELTLLDANCGITDNLSVGVRLPIALSSETGFGVVFITPKFSVPVAEKLRLGVGAMLGFVRTSENQLQGGGIGYGLATYGTASANLTLGLGYASSQKINDGSPLVVLGGNIRITRRLFLTDETYLVRDYTASILGVRVAGPRLSVGAGVLYGPIIDNIYFPLPHLDIAYRFGKAK